MVLLPGFQTNTIILAELLDYMGQYYNIYFIDYPGFNNKIPAFTDVSMEQFVKYSEEQIKLLKLDSYILGGISFGFMVVNKMKVDKHCLGILAIEPFLGMHSLGIAPRRLRMLLGVGSFVNRYELYDLAFQLARNKLVERVMTGGVEHSVGRIINTTDPKTYFLTFRLMTEINDPGSFQSRLPHVILMNPNDNTINYKYVREMITRKVDKVKVLNMDMKHFPTDLSRSYFAEKLPAELFIKINQFIT